MAEEIDYSKYPPTKPPEGVMDWLRKTGRFADEYLVYKSLNKDTVQCTCTSCQVTFNMPRVDIEHYSCSHALVSFGFENVVDDEYINVTSGDETKCPYCDSNVDVLHVSRISRYGNCINSIYVMTVHKIENRLALLTWHIKRTLMKSGETKTEINPYEGYLILDRKIIRFTGYQKCLSTTTYLGRLEQRKQFKDTWGKTSVATNIFPWDPDILNGTTAENCKLDMYMKCDTAAFPVTYMNLWLKHKNVENLIVQGAGKIVNEKIMKLNSYYVNHIASIRNIEGINWKAVKPHEMLGIPKETFGYIKKDKWGLAELDFYKEASKYGIRPDDMEECNLYLFSEVKKLFNYNVNIMKALRYLDKQDAKYPEQRKADIGDLIDYWDTAEKLGDDLSLEDARFPQNLIRAHDTAVQRMEWKTNAELARMFDDRYEQLKKFCYSSGSLEIHPAQSQHEMISEGKILHHCVGGYAKRHAQGQTAIFFIRHTNAPDIPYFTLELNEKNLTVQQNRGLYNCARTDEVKEFETEWLEYIKRISEEEKKHGKQRNKQKSAA